ncbi:MAG: tetratricopeptide repeat protein [Magnetococcales bacterium]|nr:tetratricopeptide repeat protein [Magnetococcales bacterium]
MPSRIPASSKTQGQTLRFQGGAALPPPIRPLMEFFAYMAPTGFPKKVFFQFAHLLPTPLTAIRRSKGISLLDDLDRRGLIIHSKEDIHLFGPTLAAVRQSIAPTRAHRIIQEGGQFLLATLPNHGKPTVEPHELNRLSWHSRVLADHALKIGNKEIATKLMHWLDCAGRKLIGTWPDRAINCHQSALNLSQRILGFNHHLTIVRLNNLGETWRRIKETTQAEYCLLGALLLLTDHLGQFSHLEANILGNLGLLRSDQKQWGEAREAFNQAWSMAKESRGLNDPLIFLCANNLARIMGIQNDFQGAAQFLEQALECHYQGNHPPAHPNVAIILNNLGLVQRKMGITEEARTTLAKALTMAEKCLPPGHTLLTQLKEGHQRL